MTESKRDARAALEKAAGSVADRTLPYRQASWSYCATGHLYRAIHGVWPRSERGFAGWLGDRALVAVIASAFDADSRTAAMALSNAVARDVREEDASSIPHLAERAYRDAARRVLLAAAVRAGVREEYLAGGPTSGEALERY